MASIAWCVFSDNVGKGWFKYRVTTYIVKENVPING